MKRKRLSEKNQHAVKVYEAAALRIEEGRNSYACLALEDVEYNSRIQGAFERWFKPKQVLPSGAWWPARMSFSVVATRSDTMRILALLLMAELVRDGQIDFDSNI